MCDLTVEIGRSIFKNPVFTASGTFGYGFEFSEFFDISLLGAVTVKGLSLEPVHGNPGPRIFETPSGMLNAIGLQNIGVREFVRSVLPRLREAGASVIVNIYGKTEEEYIAVASILTEVDGVEAIELNISCPNVKEGGIAFGANPLLAHNVVAAARKATEKTLIVKLSPNVTDITEIAIAVEEAGADGISLINTLIGMVIDVEKRKAVLGSTTGGLSGPAIKPVALRMVHQVYRKVKVPVIGIGGIMTYRDALEFFLAGARAIQVGTANFVNPCASVDILRDLEEYFEEAGVKSLMDYVGTVETGGGE